jgi:hypothetical protein
LAQADDVLTKIKARIKDQKYRITEFAAAGYKTGAAEKFLAILNKCERTLRDIRDQRKKLAGA